MPYKDDAVRKAKNKEYSKKHYEANNIKIKLKTKTTKANERAKWYLFKSTLKCINCGFSHRASLDFHHEDPTTKEGDVHRFISSGQFAKAYEEIKKCIVLCANCHRIHHHEDRLHKKRKRKQKLKHTIKKSNSGP
jgi:hypothetical protein